MSRKTIVVGTRGSALALTQTDWVIARMKEKAPDLDFEVKVIKTKGDKILDVALDKIGDKGLFVKEIEKELLSGEIDMAVHSMKDMPSEQPEGLVIAPPPEREDPRDVMIFREGISCIDEIPQGGKVGTGSKRRKYQLLSKREDIEAVPIRGNIQTRIKKIEELGLDAVILAAAGIKRMKMEGLNIQHLEPEEFVPAPAQGMLAIEIRRDDELIMNIAKRMSDGTATIQARAERAFLRESGGGCHMPTGAYCSVLEDGMQMTALMGDEDGSSLVKKSISGKFGEEEIMAKRLATQMKKEL
ncbi:hydroxymethylbilane synthase [Peptoclostridium litorale DSM 5388]|uniref:Porphobilinogen deaminase n=1 Tax=Peptoclostridium litorale DSM 5388 TaxID=1121324 RepID=A0A069RQR5_PEPLI|nr:hydroxymethylbilane synthase [Peptoclostridium litorale]KDR96522.1 porphobilinogen deaminase HemC [Peptoclostridium litorale DSM 5388]SIN69597.1 hydroxymethylbilane synthase [Peptoclostridium litorale DSM 5388]